jgi:hypothetical protein
MIMDYNHTLEINAPTEFVKELLLNSSGRVNQRVSGVLQFR